MAIRLIALDLDGTLLGSDHEVPAANVDAVRDACATGIDVVLASARPPRSMRRHYERLGLATPVVAYNGALIHDPALGRTLYHVPIPLPAARAAVAFLRRVDPGLNLSVELDDVWHIDEFGPDLQQVVRDYGIDPPHGVGTVDRILAEGRSPALKILFSAAEMSEAELAALDACLGPEVCAVRTSSRLVEVVAAGASKARATAWLAETLGVSPAEVLAAGDSFNDIPLLEWAGTGVAMGNAPEAVRRAADVTTLANDEAGVADAIRRWALP